VTAKHCAYDAFGRFPERMYKVFLALPEVEAACTTVGGAVNSHLASQIATKPLLDLKYGDQLDAVTDLHVHRSARKH